MKCYNCFRGLFGKCEKDKGEKKSSETSDKNNGPPEHPNKKMEGQEESFSFEELVSASSAFPEPFTLSRAKNCNIKFLNHETEMGSEIEDVTHQVEDGNDQSLDVSLDNYCEREYEKDAGEGLDMVRSRDLSDPGIGRSELCPSARVTRSCSDLGLSARILRRCNQFSLRKYQYFEEIHGLVDGSSPGIGRSELCPSARVTRSCSDLGLSARILRRCNQFPPRKYQYFEEIHGLVDGSSPSDVTSWSADQVLLKEHSPTMKRVDQWVEGVLLEYPFQDVKEDDVVDLPRSSEGVRSSGRISIPPSQNSTLDTIEEIPQANSVVRLLNSSSTVAHMVALGLNVVPQLSLFAGLRFVNLSSNSIVHIAPGSLPRSLHTLNLSRNSISVIMGLKELTRLRVLDLSYNRITRIGQGLSNSRLIKELNLAGNKISEVDGLHRLFKLAVLDLSFNKIATAKALGQLVANYNSLKGLNLLGCPIHVNIDSDQLSKKLCSLLPELSFLNKQSITPQKIRHAGTEAVVRVALPSSCHAIHREAVRKVNRVRIAAIGQKDAEKLKSKVHHHHSSSR